MSLALPAPLPDDHSAYVMAWVRWHAYVYQTPWEAIAEDLTRLGIPGEWTAASVQLFAAGAGFPTRQDAHHMPAIGDLDGAVLEVDGAPVVRHDDDRRRALMVRGQAGEVTVASHRDDRQAQQSRTQHYTES